MSIRKTIFTVVALCCMLQTSLFADSIRSRKPGKCLGVNFVCEFLRCARGN